MSHGINLGGLTSYSTGRELADLARYFRFRWTDPTDPTSAAAVDSSGYPTEDATTSTVARNYPAGVYKVSWEGSATVAFSNRSASLGPVTVDGLGVKHADLTLAAGNSLVITVTDPVAFSNLHILRPGYDEAEPRAFSVDFLRRLRPFVAVRMMAWSGVNNSNIANWADRPHLADFVWTKGKGVPLEVQVDLCNEIGRDLWINMPDAATDDYLTQAADLVFGRLDAGLNVYLEVSNEPWNSNFNDQYNRMRAVALADGTLTATDDFGKMAQWHARRVAQAGVIFKAAFGGGAARVRPLVAGQNNNTYFANKGLVFLATLGRVSDIYGIAIAPYATLPDSADVDGLTLDGLFASVNGMLTGKVIPGIQAHATIATNRGLQLVAYEGGQSLVPNRDYVILNEPVKRTAQDDPRMGDVHRSIATAWAAAGGDTFMWFGPPASIWDVNGFWGLLPNGNPDAAGGVKWDAILRLAMVPGDVDLSGTVDLDDYLLILSRMGASPAWLEDGDLDGDGVITEADLAALLAISPGLLDDGGGGEVIVPEPDTGGYWSGSYWAPGYWSESYWPFTGLAISIDTYADLLEAAVARLLADATLTGLIGAGKVFADAAPVGTALPYLVIAEPDESIDYQSAGDDALVPFDGRVELRVHCLAAGKSQARTIRRAVAAALADAPLAFETGQLLALRPGRHWGDLDPEGDADGSDAWHEYLVCDAIVSRTL